MSVLADDPIELISRLHIFFVFSTKQFEFQITSTQTWVRNEYMWLSSAFIEYFDLAAMLHYAAKHVTESY